MSGSLELPLVPIPPNREIEPLPGPIVKTEPPAPVERDRPVAVRDRVDLSAAARGFASARGILDELVADPDADAERARAGARALAEAIANDREARGRLVSTLAAEAETAADPRVRALTQTFAVELRARLDGPERPNTPTSS